MRPIRDLVLLKPRSDLFESTTELIKFSLGNDPIVLERARALAMAGETPVEHMQAIAHGRTSDPDSFAFGEVIAAGKLGNPAIVEDRPILREGDIVAYKRNRIAHELDEYYDSERTAHGEMVLTKDKRVAHLVHEHGVILAFRNGVDQLPEALSNWVLTRRDAEGFQRLLGRSLPLTDEELTHGVVTRTREEIGAHRGTRQEKRGSQVASRNRMLIERVVSVGPGRFVEKVLDPAVFGTAVHKDASGWQAENNLGIPVFTKPTPSRVWSPTEPIEDYLAAFNSAIGRCRVRIKGVEYSVTPWSEFIFWHG